MEVTDNQENNGSHGRSTQERKLCYRSLLNKTEAIQETGNVGLQTVKEIGEILQEANILNDEVNIEKRLGNTDETLLDCMVVSTASGILKKCVEAVDASALTYDPTEFANNVLSYINQGYEENSSNILLLLDEARKIIPEVPKLSCVYGSCDLSKLPVPKQKKERQKIVREKLQKKEPEKITSMDKEEEGIEEIVKMLYDVLDEAYSNNNKQPISYYDYIIDTDSYANTIENMFYFSFLIRDGKAHFDLDSKGSPIIKPMKKTALNEFRNEGGKNSQIISSITMDCYEKFKRAGLLQQKRKSKSNF